MEWLRQTLEKCIRKFRCVNSRTAEQPSANKIFWNKNALQKARSKLEENKNTNKTKNRRKVEHYRQRFDAKALWDNKRSHNGATTEQQKVEKYTECAHAVTVIVGSVLCAMVPSVWHPYDVDVYPRFSFFFASLFASFVLCCSAACIQSIMLFEHM